MNDPVGRTMLLLDIERYSDRDDVEQAYLRRVLYNIAVRALEHAGIDETCRLRADRGDSVMELIDAGASVTALLRALLTEVPAQLHGYNRLASSSAQIRLRGVVATGYVAVDEHGGWVGSDLNHACRLLDAPLLRAALRERADGFALCVSEGVHSGIVRHDHHGVPAAVFHAVTLTSKNGLLRAWLHGPVPRGTADHGDTGVGETPVPGTSGDVPAPGPPPEPPRPDTPTPETRTPGPPTPGSSAPAAPTPETTAEAPTAPTSPAERAPAPQAPAPNSSAPAAHAPETPAEVPTAPTSPAERLPAPGAPALDSSAPAAHTPGSPAAAATPPETPAEAPAAHGAPASNPPAPAASAAPAAGQPVGGGVVFNFGSGSPRFGGSLVGGDQHGVSGGQVTGDVRLGGTAGEES
ncbi:hypothetical protein ACIQ9J_05230 [Streptomyces sp. NPDC094153]|uniref:hypothetical protein n=1 Tax=Streptomyces sp. NPDC094153 TaxID=3366058 RepID=UPI0038022B15